MRYILLSLIGIFGIHGFSTGQTPEFSVTELPAMPEPVANNAVVSAMCGDTLCVYSFCGIDETKTPAGIHLKAWRFNTETQIWTALPDVPDDTGNGKIAAGASVVNNKIYLFGGYYVEDNFSEESSDDVHVFNPETNQWEADAAPIPVPIDDHVQAVWNNSLVYLVTGWSDTGNVNNVQIFDPEENSWSVGNPPINNSDYKVFGGSGEIIGNQIFYHGGVKSSFGFFPTSEVRKGTINPNDPTDIEWEIIGESEIGTTYRAAALSLPSAHSILWIGGSELGYNFDGIDYNNTGGVEPYGGIKVHNIYTDELMVEATVSYDGFYILPMDLRGIARVSSIEEEAVSGIHESIVCGGMAPGQFVSDQVFLISSSTITDISEEVLDENELKLSMSDVEITISSRQQMTGIELTNSIGQILLTQKGNSTVESFTKNQLATGFYFVKVTFEEGEELIKKVFIQN